MKLSEIAAVSGKGGLFKVLKPAKAGLILESMDENKTKIMASGSHKVSLLDEISIYNHTKEGTTPLEEVLKKIHKDFGDDIGLDVNAEGAELKALQGMGDLLDNVDYIYTEINVANLYKDCGMMWEIDRYLFNRGFVRFDTHITDQLWGDAFYYKMV